MNYAFKKIPISEVEKRWLEKIAKAEFSEIDLNNLKVDFADELRSGFDPKRIDHILTQDERLTLLGYWHLDNEHEIIDQTIQIIEWVQNRIIQKDVNHLITASEISQKLNANPERGEIILRLLFELGGFFQTGGGPDRTEKGMKHARLREDNKAYDEFLMFQNIEERLEDFYLRRSNKRFSKDPVWPKVNRQINSAKELLSQAQSAEDFQNVGLCCREALISLSQEVYNEQKYKAVDGKKPSKTDYKRMLNAYISTELGGSSNEEFRSLVKKVKRVANATQHKRTADNLHARLCVEATTSLIEMIRILDQEKNK